MVMEEAELEEWFGEARERLEAVLLDALQSNKDVEHAKIVFDHKYRVLIQKYQMRQEQMYAHQKRVQQLQKPITKYKAWLADMQAARKQWIMRQKEAVRAWWFERRIQKILHDKSDL